MHQLDFAAFEPIVNKLRAWGCSMFKAGPQPRISSGQHHYCLPRQTKLQKLGCRDHTALNMAQKKIQVDRDRLQEGPMR